MTKARTRTRTRTRTITRTKSRLRKRTKTRSARGGVYTSFPPSDLKKGTEAIKYEKFGKTELERVQSERKELDDYNTKLNQTECSRIDNEIESHEREITRLKLEKTQIRCTRKSMFGF
jgi:hypothetical protein